MQRNSVRVEAIRIPATEDHTIPTELQTYSCEVTALRPCSNGLYIACCYSIHVPLMEMSDDLIQQVGKTAEITTGKSDQNLLAAA